MSGRASPSSPPLESPLANVCPSHPTYFKFYPNYKCTVNPKQTSYCSNPDMDHCHYGSNTCVHSCCACLASSKPCEPYVPFSTAVPALPPKGCKATAVPALRPRGHAGCVRKATSYPVGVQLLCPFALRAWRLKRHAGRWWPHGTPAPRA